MSDVQYVYQKLTEAGLSEQEIKEEIKRKEREFKGFITPQGALFLIAKENGIEILSSQIDPELYEEVKQEIDYNEFTILISDLRENLTNIVLLGKITHTFPINEFMRKDGTSGNVGSFLISDTSGSTKIVLWDDHTKIMQTEFFKIGTIIRVINCYCKKGLKDRLEVHLSKQGRVQLNPDDITEKQKTLLEQIEISISNKSNNSSADDHKDINIKDLLGLDGFIKEISGMVKIDELKEFDRDDGEKSFLLRFRLYDETSSINVLVWGMQAIEILRMIENGIKIKLMNVFIEKNEYNNIEELHFTKKSILKII
ncbi:MAG: DUF2240 family protein [Promethearchaeota archaeon]|nr:MAG: DUF2240 family protein [Candidatus Lokiarchaeota archaeon]